MILWWILIIVLIIVGSMWFRKFLQGVKKVQAAQKVVDKEMEEIERLSLLEAETRAQSLLQEALTREWTEPPSLEIDARLSLLDASVSKLLRKFRTIRFDPSETEISADFLLNADLPDDLWMIGLNRPDDYKLGVRPGSPVVYSASEKRVLESYPSIFHYILQVEVLD